MTIHRCRKEKHRAPNGQVRELREMRHVVDNDLQVIKHVSEYFVGSLMERVQPVRYSNNTTKVYNQHDRTNLGIKIPTAKK